MSYPEYLLWTKYRAKNGPLNPSRMYDFPAAIIASQINNGFGGKATPKDFMPYVSREDVVEEVDTDGFIAALGAGVKHGR